MVWHLEWLIPIIMLILWIVNSLFRNKEEEAPKRRARPMPRTAPDPDNFGSQKKTSNDIDQFLDEINRRRRQALERRATTERASPPPPVIKIAPESRPKAKPKTQPQRGRTRDLGEWRSTDLAAERVAEAAAEVIPVVLPATALVASPPSRPAAFPSAEPLPGVQSPLEALLRSPENLKAAIMLREVFGPPLCRRRGAL